MPFEYPSGAQLDDLRIAWFDPAGNLRQFASGWTFSLKVGVAGSAAVFTKTSGITGANTRPNITVAWATSGELASLTVGTVYQFQLTATRTSDSKKLTKIDTILITPIVT